jgi:hypothetical protein
VVGRREWDGNPLSAFYVKACWRGSVLEKGDALILYMNPSGSIDLMFIKLGPLESPGKANRLHSASHELKSHCMTVRRGGAGVANELRRLT